MRCLALAVLCVSAVFAQAPAKSKDVCAPPPGVASPALPARIMTGQGTEFGTGPQPGSDSHGHGRLQFGPVVA